MKAQAIHTFVPLHGQLTPDISLWALSFSYAKSKIGPVSLYATEKGHELLSKIPYSERVVIDDRDVFEECRIVPPFVKLLAYQRVDRPFVHIDGDAFQTKPIPQRLLDAPWWCFREGISRDPRICQCAPAISAPHSSALAREAFQRTPHLHPWFNILGGTDFAAFNQSACKVIDVIHDDFSRGNKLTGGWPYEEYLMGCFLRDLLGGPGVFAPPMRKDDSGHIHLVGDTKNDAEKLQKVRKRLRIFNLALYETLFDKGDEEMRPA